MREIKFRGWHSGDKVMFSAETMAEDQLTLLPTGSFINVHGVSTKFSTIYPNDEFIPLQFTGLKDESGEEIYEGDIIELWSYTSDDGHKIDAERRQVIYMADCGYPAFELDGWDHESNGLAELTQSGEWKYEVIGNIYENPELLPH